ncbi:hypothetical protein HMPREF0080_01763 [Anaeroglobus geminatus F0357]|uniref:Uncharacterized protein n=1 Tax=Anaeroglobus geminatus F0357 TaxID=861450 RepID=G9YJB8_9FIRM|nr:hypothetical protein HMPREF0080_01763 [Anaeroglobus geminatus F0357]
MSDLTADRRSVTMNGHPDGGYREKSQWPIIKSLTRVKKL